MFLNLLWLAVEAIATNTKRRQINAASKFVIAYRDNSCYNF